MNDVYVDVLTLRAVFDINNLDTEQIHNITLIDIAKNKLNLMKQIRKQVNELNIIKLDITNTTAIPNKVTTLNIYDCDKITELYIYFNDAIKLHIQQCKNLKDLYYLPYGLKTLHINYCDMINLSSINAPIESLQLIGCNDVSIEELQIKSLKRLYIENCKSITSVDNLQYMQNLQSIILIQSNITKLTNIPKTTKLLYVENCEDLTLINNLPELEELFIINCTNLNTYIRLPPSLKYLYYVGKHKIFGTTNQIEEVDISTDMNYII